MAAYPFPSTRFFAKDDGTMHGKLPAAMLLLALASCETTRHEPERDPIEGHLPLLSWMAGYWRGAEAGTSMEEIWLPPEGGLMLGLHRDIDSEGRTSFEFLRIESSPAGTVYWASPQGSPPTPFALKELKVNAVVFENPEHDFPQRILYRLEAGGLLHARIEGVVDGEPLSSEWTWSRAMMP